MNTLSSGGDNTSQLDHSLTSMEWLNRLPVNKPATTLTPTSGGPSALKFPDSTSYYHAKDLNGTMTIAKIPIVISTESAAQRAEPNRPVDLNAEYKGGGEHNRRDGKPPYSYVNLITFAINSTPKKRMTLNEIYQWISDNFHYYRRVGNGWKRVQRTKDDPGKGSYWTIDNNYNEIALNNPVKMKQKNSNLTFKNDAANHSLDLNSNSSTSDSPQNSVISPSESPHVAQHSDQITPGSASSVEGGGGLPTTISTSFVDTSPYFNDLNASFKRLYKSVLTNRATVEQSFRMKMNTTSEMSMNNFTQSPAEPMNLQGLNAIHEPTLNAINSIDYNTSFDNFIQNIKLASAEVNWNDIDTSQFKSLVENIRTGDKNNWNLSSNEFVNLASSLSNFFAQSGVLPKASAQQMIAAVNSGQNAIHQMAQINFNQIIEPSKVNFPNTEFSNSFAKVKAELKANTIGQSSFTTDTKEQQVLAKNDPDASLNANSESLNLLPSSFNFELNLSKGTLQFVNQFGESRFNSLPYDPSTSNGLMSQAISHDANNQNNSGGFDSTGKQQHHSSSDLDHNSSNTSANTNKSNNPLLSCSTFNNESDDETNWDSLL